jgi:GNAT superfamily N-acetyltransferase
VRIRPNVEKEAVLEEAPSVRLRPAVEADVPTILALIRELAEYERMLDQVEATEERLRRSLFGARPHAEAVLACAGEEALGFALFFHNYSTFLGLPGIYLEDLYVRPHARRRGIGRMLLTHLARLAIERGCGRVEWSVLDWNEPAIRFYRSIGARPMDEWTVFRVTGSALEALADLRPAPDAPGTEAI